MSHDRFEVKTETQGRWRGILASLGLTERQLSGRNVECPLCRNGPKSDRFKFDDKDGRGTWICSACGAGDGVALVEKLHRVDFKGALELIKPIVGDVAFVPPKARIETPTEAREEMASLWRRASPLTGNCLASRYLSRRGIERASWASLAPSLRFVEELAYREESGPTRYLPALLAKFVAPDGKSAILHRTWLEEPGNKAKIQHPRKMWRGKIPEGGAVRLAEAKDTLGVAEGIETALSAEDQHQVPVWACASAGELVKFQPPLGCKHLIVFGDSDASFTGQYAAYGLAHRLAVAPLDRRIQVEVRFPAYWDTGEEVDWNDVRNREAAE